MPPWQYGEILTTVWMIDSKEKKVRSISTSKEKDVIIQDMKGKKKTEVERNREEKIKKIFHESLPNKDINSTYSPFCPGMFSNLTFLLSFNVENTQPN